MNSNAQTVVTADGTVTLYLPDVDETYHSVHGALTESLHVYIGAGLEALKGKAEIRVLEIGFGTGLNALLSLQFSQKNNQRISYFTIEKFPLPEQLYAQLEYGLHCNAVSEFEFLHTAEWDKSLTINPFFTLTKIKGSAEEMALDTDSFDLIFYDAFAPRVQPELWTTERFECMFALLRCGGILVTYCAKGEVKRNLKSAGFRVESLPGPPGKREMTRAVKEQE